MGEFRARKRPIVTAEGCLPWQSIVLFLSTLVCCGAAMHAHPELLVAARKDTAGGPGTRLAFLRRRPEALLRAAVVRTAPTVLNLTADVILTGNLPTLICPDLTVIGHCLGEDGRIRRCKIDGQGLFEAFNRESSRGKLALRNLEITGVKEVAVYASVSLVVITDCLFTKNVGTTSDRLDRALIHVFSLDCANEAMIMTRTIFEGNKGRMLAVQYGSFNATDVIFRSNHGGPLIGYYAATLNFNQCGFEKNSATDGPVALITTEGSIVFSQSWFVDNSLTEEGARGGVVAVSDKGMLSDLKFCDCNFERNTIRVSGGRKRIEHVYVGNATRLAVCRTRPHVVVALSSPTFAQSIDDSCMGCPLPSVNNY